MIVACGVGAEGQVSYSHEYRLRAELIRRYDDVRRQMVPGQDQDLSPLALSFGLVAINIMEFDESKEVITLYGWNKMMWKDVNLQWDAADYGGRTSLRLPSNLMWRPDMVLYNSLELGSGQDESVRSAVFSDGTVLFIPPSLSTVHCTRVASREDDDSDDDDDNQGVDSGRNQDDDDNNPEWTCNFKYGSWVYDGYTVSLQPFNNATLVDMDYFIPDRKYEVVGSEVKINTKYYPCCPEPYPDITFTLQIRRR